MTITLDKFDKNSHIAKALDKAGPRAVEISYLIYGNLVTSLLDNIDCSGYLWPGFTYFKEYAPQLLLTTCTKLLAFD